ncbi:hypothetical protein PybrP1_004495 [[Pythium] brassicae (nom. inval.)]|nr:hypothetical protein PybrP1_004495 [[Pythium] brassicae (nom. inval.)]
MSLSRSRSTAAGGARAAASAHSLQRQGSSSASATSAAAAATDGASYETDEEFAQALSSYDVPQVADALRRYLAFEVQASLSSATSKQQSAQIKGKFYERFNQILDRVFGNDDVSKHKFGGWLDYSAGVAGSGGGDAAGGGADASGGGGGGGGALLKKKRSTAALFREADVERYMEALSANGRALLRLLGGGRDDDGSIFQFLFRVTHPVEFKLELDMLPEQSKMSIMARSAYTSALFTQLLHKPLAKQLIDLRSPVLLVTIKELYLFYFLRHPASASHQSAPSGGSGSGSGSGADADAALAHSPSLIGSLSESFSKAKRAPDASWRRFVHDGVVSLTRGNPYNVLLLQYLRAFLPETAKAATAESRFHAKVLQHASLFLHILIEFWLRQNLIVFADEPLGAHDSDGSVSAAAAAAAYARAPAKPASPLAAVQTYTSYMAPSDDLLSSLVLTLIHLLADPFYPAVLATPPAGATPSKSSFHPSLVTGGGGGYLTTSISVLRRPLYEFFRLVFSRAPIGLSPTAFLAITDVWLAYLQPWCCRGWAAGAHGSSSSEAPGLYSPAWATYVLANYHFYTVLLGAFVERAKELDFSGSDERGVGALDRVLSVYTPELLGLLRGAARFFERSQPFGGTPTHAGGRAGKAKSALDARDDLSPAQGSILTFYTKALGIECAPVPLHSVFHRDAERLFDKLWSDSGASAVANSSGQPPASGDASVATPSSTSSSSSSSDFVSSVFRAGGAGADTGGAEKFLDRVQRLSRSLRRVFEISDAYVASSSHSRSLGASSGFGGRESFAPSRDARRPHLLTRAGVYELLGGFRMCTPDAAAYLGDPMLRPICSFEVPCLVRASYKFSTWLNAQLGLPNPYHGKRFEDNLDVDPERALAAFRFNFRFLASKANLAFLAGFLLLIYVLHLW